MTATILVIVVIVALGAWRYSGWFKVHEEQVVIREAIRKTAGGETREVEYFLYTNKGYFRVGGPVDAEGIPYVWQLAKENEGKLVLIRYYGGGVWRIDAWAWYPSAYEVHTVPETS